MHNGQFAILKEEITLPGFQSIRLDEGWILSWHKKLQVRYDEEKKRLLLGTVWQAEEGRPDPWMEVCTLDKEQLLSAEASWCGRYVLILDGTVYLDAAGLFGVFYSDEGISSDLSLLAGVLNAEREDWEPDDIMRWYPAPGTPFKGISRLMPSQSWNIEKKKTAFRQILAEGLPEYHTEEELMDEFIRLFCSSLKNLQAEFPEKKLLIALTGGYDSRTLLALALKAGIDFECYTLEHDRMPLGDIEYPPKLCSLTGSSYTYYPRHQDRFSPEREEEYLAHLSHMQREQDRTFYAYGQYQELEEKYGPIILLRSGVWEIAQEYDRRAVPGHADLEPVLNYYELSFRSPEAKAFRKFFSWFRKHPLPLTDTDRYFWEQRCGSWIAESEHGFDIYENTLSLQPLNCRKLITMLFGFPEEERMIKFHQAKITAKLCPEIKDIPYGKNEVFTNDRLRLAAGTAGKLMRRLRKIGLRRTWHMYRHIAEDKIVTKAVRKKNDMERPPA